MTGIDWAQTVVLLGAPLLIFIGRNWLISHIAASVNHKFNERLENLRADLRAGEAELAALRESVFSRRLQRDVKLDDRRLVAVERIWAATMGMAPMRMVATMMVRINTEEVAKNASDPRVQKMFKMISGSIELEKITNPARDERPFVTEAVWAQFQAYSTLVTTATMQAKMFEMGIGDKLLKIDSIKAMMKAALPQYSKLIDENSASMLGIFLEDLEENIIKELRRTLAGGEEDADSIARSNIILKAVDQVRQTSDGASPKVDIPEEIKRPGVGLARSANERQ